MAWYVGRRHDEVDEEIRSHLALAERDRLERGETPRDARTRARREFGNPLRVSEATAAMTGHPVIEGAVRDIAQAIRRIRLRPGIATAVVLMLALAIGIATTMFTIADALVLRPLPFRQADRLITLYMGTDRGGNTQVSPAVLRAWRDTPVFEGAEGATSATAVLETSAGAVVRATAAVSPNLVAMLGVQPILGRTFGSADLHGGVEAAAISEDLWRGSFGSDTAVLGRVVRLDGKPVQIVGVMPSSFRFPAWNTEVWRAVDFDAQPSGSGFRPVAFLRLAPGTSLEQAVAIATDRAHAADPATLQLTARSNTFTHDPNGYYQQATLYLGIGVLLVFLVLGANASSLLLARFVARRPEFGLCSALGAPRSRLLRQTFLESAVLVVAGSLLGLCLAWVLVSLAAVSLPEAFLAQSLNPLNVDARAALVAVGCGAISTVLAALLPAFVSTREHPAPSMTPAVRGGTDTRASRAMTRILLVGQVAFASTLLITAALFIRSFVNMSQTERGFNPTGIITTWVTIDREMAPTVPARLAVVNAVGDALATVAGVQGVSWSSGGPMTSASNLYFDAEWVTDRPGATGVAMSVEESVVSPEFFDLYGIRMIRGRTFARGEDPNAVIVAERFAAALWPGEDPVGRSFTGFGSERYHVVGLVRETNRPSADSHLDMADLYSPLGPTRVPATANLKCGTRCPSEAVVREAVRRASPAASVYQVSLLDQAYERDLAQPRATAVVGSTFAAVALAAAASGLFSVLTYGVGRRRREFGVRLALGSTRDGLRRMVLAEGARLTAGGLALGMTGAWFLATTLAALLYRVSVTDVFVWTTAPLVCGTVTFLASWLPARQAMQADPAALLRSE